MSNTQHSSEETVLTQIQSDNLPFCSFNKSSVFTELGSRIIFKNEAKSQVFAVETPEEINKYKQFKKIDGMRYWKLTFVSPYAGGYGYSAMIAPTPVYVWEGMEIDSVTPVYYDRNRVKDLPTTTDLRRLIKILRKLFIMGFRFFRGTQPGQPVRAITYDNVKAEKTPEKTKVTTQPAASVAADKPAEKVKSQPVNVASTGVTKEEKKKVTTPNVAEVKAEKTPEKTKSVSKK